MSRSISKPKGEKKDRTPKILADLGYTIGKTIGRGTYSKVCLSLDQQGKRYACKIIDKNTAGEEFIEKFLPRELQILSLLEHPNIVRVYTILELYETVYLFMDYCNEGDLLEYLRARGPLSENKAKLVFGQIVNAVHYLHNLDIAHRDLKCENVFLLPDSRVKLGDFGFARYCRSKSGMYTLSDTFCGSAAYAAPEILQGHHYDPKMYDVWALGCILYTILNASLPFDDNNVTRMVKEQKSRSILDVTKRWDRASKNLKRLQNALLEPDILKRMTVNQIVRHPWFRQVNMWSLSDSYLL